jgi:hypothetical protein
MPYDYSGAPPPRDLDLIPAGTIASVQLRIRSGNAGEDGYLTRSKDPKKPPCEMLDCEFVVVDGTYAKRKFWSNFVLAGTTAGHAQAAEISRGTLRSILESARNIKPNDMSDQARADRTADLKDFDNIVFIARIGIEKGKPKNDGSGENYADKNVIAGIITPDKKDWHPVEQPPLFNGGGAGAAASPVAPASSAAPATPAAGVPKPAWGDKQP